jgi:hypothetical protein
MESGIYIITLNNQEPISVNAQDPRVVHDTLEEFEIPHELFDINN